MALPATSVEVLPVVEQRSITEGCGAASGVAWWSDDELLVACSDGIHRFDLSSGAWSSGLPSDPLPAGLSNARDVATDGRRILGWAYYDQYLGDGEDGARVFARRNPDFQVLDMAVLGDRMYLLGWKGGARGPADTGGVAAWTGPASTDWSQLQPLHRIGAGAEAVKNFGETIGSYGGALAVGADGTVAVATTIEPGIHVYDREGRLREVLGSDLDGVVVRRMFDAMEVYRMDVEGRYREVLNRQPMVDDVVLTAGGPALVVRRPKGTEVSWELWFPATRGLREAHRLDVRSRRPYAHADCDARGTRLACVFLDRRPETPTWELDGSGAESVLVLFDVVRRTGSPGVAAAER